MFRFFIMLLSCMKKTTVAYNKDPCLNKLHCIWVLVFIEQRFLACFQRTSISIMCYCLCAPIVRLVPITSFSLEGKCHTLNVIRRVEQTLANDLLADKEYLPIAGLPEFNKLSAELIFSSGSKTLPPTCGYLPDPTYGNHPNLLSAAGLTLKTYRYHDPKTHGLDFQGLMEDLGSALTGFIVLFHARGHNPTGVDPTCEQWEQIRRLVRLRGLFPFFDCAYQVCKTADVAMRVESHLRLIIRPFYSNPPIHGAAIVTVILKDRELYEEWTTELKAMSDRFVRVRRQLYNALCKRGTPGDWSHIIKQVGMWISFGVLSSKAVPYLADAIHDAVGRGL
ncbi:RNA polymerase I-associated factor PAF67 isoform 1 [Hibiscus syriacus]|uniref:RNA polymerase I-associated factor PAF67 isoform 1 n=1 Tax=Hibiscus syriacus TaxID=106335 RepID=A0A6A2X858_HIBSY|nr:RNA polymerase I-associated factor PAF67 isoform 1 [Hibiscus syriacus]